MMPHALETDDRSALECWAMQWFENEVCRNVLFHDSGTLHESKIEEIESSILADAQALVCELPIDRLKDRQYMNIMIGDSISETKDRLRKAAARQEWENQRRRRA